jgi:hypothetical protein
MILGAYYSNPEGEPPSPASLVSGSILSLVYMAMLLSLRIPKFNPFNFTKKAGWGWRGRLLRGAG